MVFRMPQGQQGYHRGYHEGYHICKYLMFASLAYLLAMSVACLFLWRLV